MIRRTLKKQLYITKSIVFDLGSLFVMLILVVLWVLCSPKSLKAAETKVKSIKKLSKNKTSIRIKTLKSNPKLAAQWKVGIGSSSFQEALNESDTASLRTHLKAYYLLTPWLNFFVNGQLRINSSRVQERFDESSSNPFKFNEFVVRAQAHQAFQLEAGGVNQASLGVLDSSDKTSLLLDNRAFPGVKVISLWQGADVRLAFSAQKAIPTSHSLNDDRVDKEVRPSFSSETIEVEVWPTDGLLVAGFASHYAFGDLPAKVADESRTLGNEIVGDGPISRFAFEFDGWLAGGKVCLCFSDLVKLNVGTYLIENSEALESANRGQMSYLSLDMAFNGIHIQPKFATYFNESDTTPGFYNSGILGHNNRKGQIIELGFDFKRHNFILKAQYVEAETINTVIDQDDFNSFRINLETTYAEI